MSTTTTAAIAEPIAVSIRTAAGMLELPDFTIRQAVYSGELHAAAIGARVRIATADLRDWFEAQA